MGESWPLCQILTVTVATVVAGPGAVSPRTGLIRQTASLIGLPAAGLSDAKGLLAAV